METQRLISGEVEATATRRQHSEASRFGYNHLLSVPYSYGAPSGTEIDALNMPQSARKQANKHSADLVAVLMHCFSREIAETIQIITARCKLCILV